MKSKTTNKKKLTNTEEPKTRPYNLGDVEEILILVKINNHFYPLKGSPGRAFTYESREVALRMLLENHDIDFEIEVEKFGNIIDNSPPCDILR